MTLHVHFVWSTARQFCSPVPLLLGALCLPASSHAQSAPDRAVARLVLPVVVPVAQTSDASTQPAAPADQPAAPTPAPSPGLPGGLRMYGTVDTYYAYNFNEPGSGTNVLRNFDEQDNQFSMSYAEIAVEQAPTTDRRVGFRADFGFGPTATWIDSVDPNGGELRYVQQAYVSVLTPVGRGLQIDAGKFVTPIGAEPIETFGNWNYSRSLLFSWAAPYYHAGVRASLPISDTVSVSGFLLNGWNNAEDNNRAKTVAAQVTWKPTSSLSVLQAYMGGREGPQGSDGVRHLFDTVATWTVTPRLALMTNVDIGRDQIDGQTVAWQGVAAYGRVMVTPTWAVSPRVEVFEDRDGFATGTAQTLRELTLTSEHILGLGVSLRLEYRRDWSTEDFFEYRADRFRPQQNTLLVGLTYAMSTP